MVVSTRLSCVGFIRFAVVCVDIFACLVVDVVYMFCNLGIVCSVSCNGVHLDMHSLPTLTSSDITLP